MSAQILRLPVFFVSTVFTLTWLAVSPPGACAAELKLYVSPAGNDSWSGRLAQPNDDKTDGPLATLQKARDLVRESKAATGKLSGPVSVNLRAGVYRQKETLVFTPTDSGSKESPITYQAHQGEKAIISGGAAIRGWQIDVSEHSKNKCGGKLWRTTVPTAGEGEKWRFNQLFVDEQRRTRARHPNKGSFLRTDGPLSKSNSRGFFFKEGDLEEWDHLREAIFVLYHSWETSIHHVRSLDMEAHQVTLLEPAPWPMGRWERQQRYYVENVFEVLDEPGEWYLNRRTNTLYYYPLAGETMAEVEAIAPALTSTLIRFEGAPEKGETVEHLHFRGIGFQHSNADLKRLRNPGQGEIYQPGLIMAGGLRHASFDNCEIAHTGAHALWLATGCEDVHVQRCHLHDLGGGGVYIGGGWGVNENPPAQRNTVDNCFIHDGGHLFHGAHGVWIGKSSHNRVTHNEISNFDYSGISCGWSWGFQPSSAHHNILDYNHIHHLSNGEGLSDMGGIYTLGVSPGTTERFNHIHHIYSYAHVSHGSGVYPDEGSSEILIENNVVYRVRNCPLFQHYGKDCLIRNNILAFGDKGQLRRSREDKPCHYIAEGNIVYADIKEMLDGVWKSGDWKLGRNVYWSTAGEPEFAGMNFEAWKEKWGDDSSIVADPLFVDPANYDFRLKPDSPALKLGFKPIDLGKIGLYGDPEWVALPKQYPNRPLNDIPAPVEPPFFVNFDFEADEQNEEPLEGKTARNGAGQTLAVSRDTGAGGSHQSLKFVDTAGAPHRYTPHIYYYPSYTSGKLRLAWDMLNSRDKPADFSLEVRQWDEDPYLVGPTVSVAADGTVSASGKSVGRVPLGEWVHVDIAFELGEGAAGTYQITLSAPGGEPIVAEVPFRSGKFERVTWFGIMSNSDADAVFHLDNLKLGTPAELEQPPIRKPRVRQAKAKRSKPANDQMLMGHWKFDAAEGYVAQDSSGYENHGDLWASWAEGDFGTAVYCDAAAGTIEIPDAPSLRLGKSDFSIELWVCPTQLDIDSKDGRRRFMEKSDHPHTWWNLNITTDGKPFLETIDDNKVSGTIRPSGTIPENAWTHLAIVVDRTKGKMLYYYNGKLDSARDIPARFTGSLDVEDADLTIGSRWQPFIGLLDEVKIFKRALTEKEIRASYEKEKAKRENSAFEIIE